MCSMPVTFGGGRTIEKVSAVFFVIPFCIQISGLNTPESSHALYTFSSVSSGLYGVRNLSSIPELYHVCIKKKKFFLFFKKKKKKKKNNFFYRPKRAHKKIKHTLTTCK